MDFKGSSAGSSDMMWQTTNTTRHKSPVGGGYKPTTHVWQTWGGSLWSGVLHYYKTKPDICF
jgi:hypothetical protein